MASRAFRCCARERYLSSIPLSKQKPLAEIQKRRHTREKRNACTQHATATEEKQTNTTGTLSCTRTEKKKIEEAGRMGRSTKGTKEMSPRHLHMHDVPSQNKTLHERGTQGHTPKRIAKCCMIAAKKQSHHAPPLSLTHTHTHTHTKESIASTNTCTWTLANTHGKSCRQKENKKKADNDSGRHIHGKGLTHATRG